MKKLVAGLSAAFLIAAGGVATEGAFVASHAATSVSADNYPDQPALQKTVANIKAQIKADNMTKNKAAKFIKKLKNYKKAGLISQAKFKKLKIKIQKAI
jgi:elongation factor P hydroxylase